MDHILQKFRGKFLEEAQDILNRLEKDLLDIENGAENPELIESAFRVLHTLKGISSMYGFTHISEFAHHLENIWQKIREQKIIFDKELFELTFNSVDHIHKLLYDEKLEAPENKTNHKKLMEEVSKISNLSAPPVISSEPKPEKDEIRSWLLLIRVSEKMFFRGINFKSIIGELVSFGEFEIFKMDNLSEEESDVWCIILVTKASKETIREVVLFIEDDCTLITLSKGNIFSCFGNQDGTYLSENEKSVSILEYVNELVNNKKENENPEATLKSDSNSFKKHLLKRISVDSSKLDRLMFLVSELITLNSQLTLAFHGSKTEGIMPYLEKLDKLSKHFRNNALEIRLIPLSETVLRFQRLIRDLSGQLGKKVELKTFGTDTELDKNTIDQLTEPFMHIIRNCIDHGIEIPEERIKKGKPEQGYITISAYNSGNYVYISVSDDGNGIDTEIIRKKAIEKGIIKPTDNLTEKEFLNLIFLPGFSTAQSLTSVSGRGVGMDVVKNSIAALRGEILLNSEKGIGTTFTVKIQQSLSIIDTLLFTVGNFYFTVPIAEIEVCVQISDTTIKARKQSSVLPFNDNLIPFLDLKCLFNIEIRRTENIKGIIIRNETQRMVLLADSIIGEHQAVLKPLGKSLSKMKYITSASQLGNGNMAFMIDTNYLFKNISA